MKKITWILYLVLFLAVCILPSVIYPLLGPYIDQENYENRVTAEAPEFSLSSIAQFPKEYEEFFNDNLPFRSFLIEANAAIDLHIFHQSPLKKVVIGKDGWLFYNAAGTDGDPMADAAGTNYYTSEELAQVAASLTAARDKLEAEGRSFVLMVVPNKESIYGKDYLPEEFPVADVTKADHLVNYLRNNTDLNIVYPKDALLGAMEADPQTDVYLKTDTHWNNLGAYLGSKELLSAMDIRLPEISALELNTIGRPAGDLAKMMASKEYMNDDVDYQIGGYPGCGNVSESFPVEDNYDVIRYSSPGQDPRKLFMIRDSFTVPMAPFISSQFETSYILHNYMYTPEYLAQIDPDIVVVEVAERYLNYLFSFTY